MSSDRGAGRLGFDGSAPREGTAPQAALAKLAGDEFGGGAVSPMLPNTWPADADAYPSSRTAACPAADAGWPTFGVHARLRVHGRRLGHGCPSRGGEQNPQEGGLQAGRRRS
ncbi:hypothetical protein [Mycolicibacterium fortuitum]|uniref:PPW family C-terminal domain-containing PPE protein n=1 Tax=Mycolicibacterium fortuitum TaxID=1766 RepID=UPI000941EF9A|nr:hypothetical protein [Mycolicibacterium fortuitum]